MIQNIPLSYYLVISTLMFFIGIYGFLTRRNLITMLMSVELILNSVNINFVAFNRYLYPQQLQGHFFTLICCKNCINVCLKRPKINEKEAGVGPFVSKKSLR